MWSQLVKVQIKGSNPGQLREVEDKWEREVGRGTDSGWVRTQIFNSPNDPNQWYILAIFESEEKARKSEQSPQHKAAMAGFLEIMTGEPEYIDLNPVYDSAG